ncbi:mucin-associated surface protein (MASP), putative [Trypanosoma cruzi marinkellei]|uniref:Mucin-associated surface protein (MASP), putative n=1 Tax=Trypanosoma cruzi marinkellei TaxID=85056 RepID=K2N063_TRYCR|nr:mucin-associated surface protein (MASP), putative [Trypanosoma cruzi marinkellei]
MAMTMTGRVLLVCALCVLWCGAGGGNSIPPISTLSGGKRFPGGVVPKPEVKSPEVVQPETTPAEPALPKVGEDDKSKPDTPGTADNVVTGGSGGTTGKETGLEAEDTNETSSGLPFTQVTQETTESPISTGGSGGAQREAAAGDDDSQRPNPEGPQNDGTEAGNNHGPSTASGAVPPPTTTVTAAQTNATLTDNSTDETDLDRREGEEEGTQESQLPHGNQTEAPTTATLTSAQTNATRILGDSDGSTAASHTTSSLFPFLFVLACAAAAAVVAA